MKSKKIAFFVRLSLLLFLPISSREPLNNKFCFEKYNPDRDGEIVKKIFACYPDFFGVPKEKIQSALESCKNCGRVLRVGNETVGFVNNVVRKRNFLWCLPWFIGEINGIGVDELHQGKGYGKELLKSSIEEFENSGVSKVVLRVHKDNERARKLYESMGFVSKREFQSSDAVTWIVYELPVGNIIQRNPEHAYSAAILTIEALLLSVWLNY